MPRPKNHIMKKLTFLFLISLMFSCNTNTKESNTTETSSTEVNNIDWRPHPKATLNDAEKLVLDFYVNYLATYYIKGGHEQPRIGFAKDGTYYLDTIDHIDFLKKLGCFSSKYYDNQLSMYNACRKELIKLKPGQADGPPDGDCSFMSWMIWTGGQGEELNTADIINSTIADSTAQVIVAIGDSIDKYIYSYPRVELIKENGEWKISNITNSFDKPEEK